MLTTLARRLEEAVREADTVARWGGDEFTVVVPGLEGPEMLAVVRERIHEAVASPIEAGGETVHVGLTIGAVLYAETDHPRTVDADHLESLLRFASLALHWAKEDAPGGFHLFESAEGVEGPTRVRQESELREAIQRGAIVPHYQPIVRLEDGARVGVEVLARWQHPERGRLPPSEFIPMAEELGLLGRLQDVVLRRGCRDLAEGLGAGDDSRVEVAFNVSGAQFRDPELAERIMDLVEEAGCRPEQVIVEVTETAVLQRSATVEALRDRGVRVWIDDFGTQYSTFTYLKELEVDGLKIDMAFVQGIADGDSDAALVETMLTLGNRLGLDVVAEGVETEAQRERLRSLGCELGQGYLFDRPMPIEELRAGSGD